MKQAYYCLSHFFFEYIDFAIQVKNSKNKKHKFTYFSAGCDWCENIWALCVN